MKKISLVVVLGWLAAQAFAQSPAKSWLDRPLANWNAPGAGVPKAGAGFETVAEVARRCNHTVPRGTPGERALAGAGWLPYLHVDREIVQGDVEIVGGMSEADGMCRPMRFNLFVFAGGRLAGTLSPDLMLSRGDASIGAVRILPGGEISADFARYEDADALCCPSGRVTVRYRIDRTSEAVVVPVSLQRRR